MLKQVVFSSTLIAVLLVTGLPSKSQAEPRISDPVWAVDEVRVQQRELFVQAEYAARRGRLAEYQLLLEQLEGYPLVPYLQLERLRKTGFLANEDQVLAFLAEHEGTPLDGQLRRHWLNYLQSKNQQQRYVRDYRVPASIEQQCHYLRYQLALNGMPAQAIYRAVDQLWQTGESLPKACDPLLVAWQQADQRSTELVWARIKLAAEGGKHSLLPYLGGLLPESMRYLAEHYHRVRRDPAVITRVQFLTGAYPQHEADIVTYAYGRLIWRDPDRALTSFTRVPKHIVLSAAQQMFINQRFAIALTAKNHPKAATWLAQLAPADHTEQTLQWQLAEWVRQGDWQALLEFTPKLPTAAADSGGWSYWYARALAETGAIAEAESALQQVAQQRSYYGFLAAARLGLPKQLVREPVLFSAEDLKQLRNLPAVQRVYEFLQLGRFVEARREWLQLTQRSDGRRQELLAVLADQWGWHDQAIYTLAQIGGYNAVQLRFPLAYFDEHQRQSSNAGIDVDWALAITRRESAFRFDAHSHAGAHGLMQIMPKTAEYLERKFVTQQELQHVGTNIRLGTHYLGELRGRLGGNWVLATAAYNAGIYRVFDWLPQQPIDVDRWIETIPFRETRDYVKNVLAYQQIYRELSGNTDSVFTPLIPMQISEQAAGR
jgi:soluble lytic murein transglycosylase